MPVNLTACNKYMYMFKSTCIDTCNLCIIVDGVTACQAEVDAIWQIEWPFIEVGNTSVVSCGANFTGMYGTSSGGVI